MKESEVRRLRDIIYGKSTDKCWNGCKENWMKPENIEWLQYEVAKKTKKVS